MASCGLDFGTSNTTLGLVRGNAPALAPLEGGDVTIPSAIFFDWSARAAIGRAAIGAYLEGSPGRLLRSLKSTLGSSLIDEATQVGRKRLRFTEVIACYLELVKARGEAAAGVPLTHVVHGRPVHFVDGDEAGDRKAQDALHDIARSIGFSEVSFQFEPIAAALDYEQRVRAEELIADIGGGTSDFTVVRLGPAALRRDDRSSDILATGGLRLGGTDFDRKLSLDFLMPHLGHGSLQARGDIELPSGPYWDLSTWSRIHNLYEPSVLQGLRYTRRTAMQPELIERLIRVVEQRRGHSAPMAAEAAKIELSQGQAAAADLSWVEEGLAAKLSRADFDAAVAALYARLRDAAAQCAREAGIANDAVGAVFFTGGTSSIPGVRQAIAGGFAQARILDGDRFGSVGLGLAIEASRRYG